MDRTGWLFDTMALLSSKCRFSHTNQRFWYDTRRLIVTPRFWFRNADNLGVVLSAISACPLLIWGHRVFKLRTNVTVSRRNLHLQAKNASGVILSRDYFAPLAPLAARGSYPQDDIPCGRQGRASTEFFGRKGTSVPLDFGRAWQDYFCSGGGKKKYTTPRAERG